MDDAREHAISLAYVVLAVTVGLAIGHPLVSGAVIGLGTSALAPLTERVWRRCCKRLLADDTTINHDLETALRQAFRDALAHLEKRWWLEPRGRQIKHAGGDVVVATEELFRIMRDDVGRIFGAGLLRNFGTEAEAVRLLDRGADRVQEEVTRTFAAYLHGHDEHLVAFLAENIAPAVSLFFGEYLKGGKPEQERAWRAFQKLVLDSLQDTLADVRVSQAESAAMLSKLTAWAERLERLPASQRDLIGDAALNETLTGLRRDIVQAIEQHQVVMGTTVTEAIAREERATRAEVATIRGDVAGLGQDVGARLDDIRALIVSIQPEWVSAGGVGSHVPGTLPRIWNVPHPRTTNFTGRDRELAMLAEALASDQGAAAVQAMYGLGGIGKTQIAVEYAYRHAVDRDDYSIIWWVRSEHLATMVADYTGLAHPLILPTASDPDPAITVSAVRTWLEQTGEQWLLVFDNANTPEDIRPYLPRAGTGDVVITSRNPGWHAVAKPIAVDALPVSDAIAFLRARTGRDDAAAVDLVQELGRLPLALEQAAAYVTANRVSLSWYLASFREHHGRMLEQAKPHTDYPWTVATTWELAFKQLEEQVPVARDLLALCAFLAPDDIPLDVIIRGAGELPAPLSRVLVDALERTEVVAVLHRYSLLNLIDEMTLSVHRLVQLVARDRLERAERARWATEALEVILAGFPNDCNNIAHRTVCARLLPHGLAVTRHAAELKAAPVQTASLLARIALCLHARGMLQEARGAHEQVVGILEAVLPPDHPDIATSLTNQAVVLHDMGDLRGARTRLERALAILESRLPSVHPDIAATLNNLAMVLQDLGDLSGALTRLRRALAIREALLPPTHPDIATSLGNLAEVYRAQGDLTGARVLQERALAILEAVLPADHPDIATAHNNLGEVLRAKGDLAGAYARHRRALSIREAILPPDHPDLAKSLNNLAAVLRAQGDLRGAREQLERALAIRERVLPPNHPHIASSLNNLAGVLYARGDLDGALAALLRALPILQTQKLRDRERVVLVSLGTLARRLGRPAAALDLLIACYLIDRYLGHPELSSDLAAATALAKDLDLDERALTERISAVAASYQRDRGASLLTAAFPGRFEQTRPTRAG